MSINSFEELILLASTKENDLEKLKVLQQYFLENVEFNYAEELGQTEQFHPELLSLDLKKEFTSLEEKIEEINNFEKSFGESFCFPKKIREQLISYLGQKKEPYKEKNIINGLEYYLNHHGFNGSILDSIKRLSMDPIYKNGLIIYGVCSKFSEFAKNYCNHLGINSSVYETKDSHVFLVVYIDNESRIFDFTRMIGIRDGYMNLNNQQIDDWFNMSFEKMFEYKPNRTINKIDGAMLSIPITRENYTDFINNKHMGKKLK